MESGPVIRLTLERKRRGWSQAELARRSLVNATSISLIECRRFLPGPTQLEKLRKALGLRPAAAERLLEVVAVDPLPVERAR
jgi:transcriptional regulator with XRE-family HTH domain